MRADQLPRVERDTEPHREALDADIPENAEVERQEKNDPSNTWTPVLIIRSDKMNVVCFIAGEANPQTIELKVFQAIVAPPMLVTRTAQDSVPEGDIGEVKQSFGFRWFVPELLRHKSIWRDVLLASFAIQLLGLATPLFTQVVIDKVIVHQTMNTLMVIGVGLLMFMLFSAFMTWTRQYLVLHTGQRIDAVLGSRVFKHLLELPLRYYERRATGTLVARIHGIETIREL